MHDRLLALVPTRPRALTIHTGTVAETYARLLTALQ
jgi:hypothetical protein